VTVAIADAQGRVVPVAADAIAFELTGPGRILGVGNGDPSCHEPDVVVATAPLRTAPVADWRWKEIADPYAPDLPEEGIEFDDSSWANADANAESGPLGLHKNGVFRARFTVTAEDLASPAIELWFGKIDGDGSVFVNGQRIGSTGDPRGPAIYNVKARLHPGENTVAVALANYGAAAGLNRGARLRFQEEPAPVAWRRSAFNGLAQIIVQSTRDAGAIRLTARADGLQPATITIRSEAAPLRPFVP
jgi:beta-galactosidase